MSSIFDSHYDLLTYILMKRNDPEFLVKLCREIYRKDNIIGGLINTYYMPKEDMIEELNINDFDVVEHFKQVNTIIEQYHLLPDRDNFLFAIEGCRFININDLEQLYNFGLRSIIPIYNEDNQYGGGALGDQERGLTEDGKKLIDEVLKLNIAIDISHANYKTANDILDYLKEKRENGINPTLLASHSNCNSLTPRNRNITDEIIKKVGDLDGIIGILARKTFCSSDGTEDYDKALTDHVRHVINLIGIDSVCIASDDMEYHPDKSYQEVAMYDVRSFGVSIEKALKDNGFKKEEREKIMVKNFKTKVLDKINR